MAGALGTLGVLTRGRAEMPAAPKAETTLAFDCGADAAIRMSNEWCRQAASHYGHVLRRGTLAVRLSGAAPAVVLAVRTMGGEPVANAGAFWQSVRDTDHGFCNADFQGSRRLWRLSVKATTPYSDLSGDQLIEWGGALRWLWQNASADPAPVRKWALEHGGHATLFRGAAVAPGAFQPLAPPLALIHERLKATFDPHRIFNRGRLYADLTRADGNKAGAGVHQDTSEGSEAEAILRACVHCGFCTATCPTYQLLGDELDGPRGRIYLIKQVLEGDTPTAQHAVASRPLPDLPQLRDDLSLGRSYGRLVDIGRRIVDEKVGRSPAAAAQRYALRKGLPNKAAFGTALALGRLAKPFLPRELGDACRSGARPRAGPSSATAGAC